MAGGNSDRYASLVKAYERAHPTLSDDEYRRGASDARLAMYQQNKKINKAVSVQTTAAFNQINKHLEAVHALSKQIEGASNKNTKSAVDLNTRLLAEMAYIQTDLFKLQALANQQAAQVEANAIAEDSEAARFNQLPK
jgi:type IV secretion system protein VirB5